MTPEGKVKESIKRLLKDKDVFFYMPVPCGYGTVGIPDILCCVPTEITQDMVGKTLGVFMGVECKAIGKEKNTTPNQKKYLGAIHVAGGVAVVAASRDTVAEALDSLKSDGTTLYRVP